MGIGLKFEKSLALARRKINNVQSRITGKKPNDVGTHDRLKKPRKLKKGRRKHNPLQEYFIGDRVRYQMKATEITNVMYKSYGGTSRKAKHQNWSVITPTVVDKKRVAGTLIYKLSSDKKYRKGWELQKVDEVRKLEIPKKPGKQAPRLLKEISEIKKKIPKVRKSVAMKSLEGQLGTYWKPVAGRRQRKRVNYKV